MSEELRRVYQAILQAMANGDLAAVATVVAIGESGPRGAGAKMLVRADGQTVGSVGGGEAERQVIAEAQAAIAAGQPREMVYRPPASEATGDACSEGLRVFIEVLPPSPTLLIVGAGHVGQAVADLGASLGYRIVAVDDRPELVTAERFPRAAARLSGDLPDQIEALLLAAPTAVVIVTPHQTRDERVLAVLARKELAYVGLMGSRRRTAATFQRAREAGVDESFLQRVHSPIGLDIGAETPREIAVSIVAQIIAVLRGGE